MGNSMKSQISELTDTVKNMQELLTKQGYWKQQQTRNEQGNEKKQIRSEVHRGTERE